MRDAVSHAPTCSLARTLEFVGERWTFLVLREAMAGTTRFAEFRGALGIASDVLTVRLNTLVEAGIMERRAYQDPGQRARSSYHLTEAGQQLNLVLAALQQWGDVHVGYTVGPLVSYRSERGERVTARFVTEDGTVVPESDVRIERTPVQAASRAVER